MRNGVAIILLAAAPVLLAEEGAEELAAVELENMTILGEPAALTRTVGSAHRLDREELEAFAYDDINRVLRAVPGLYIRGEDGYGLRPNIGLRGANSDRSQKVTLLEDGVLFGPAPYAAPAAYYFPLSARMTGVEVFKGPASIQHGPQTIGGAINLVSAPVPHQRQGLFSLAGGSEAYRRAHLRAGGPAAGGFDVLGEVLHIGTDGFKELDGGGDTGFDKTETLLKAAHALGPGRLELRLAYAEEVSHETYLGLSEADARATPLRRYRASARDRMEWDWNSVRADYVLPLLGGRLDAVAYSHQFHRAWNKFNNIRGTDIREVLANPDTPANRLHYRALTGEIDTDQDFDDDDLLIGENDRDFRSSGVQARWFRSFGQGWKHGLEAGLRLHDDRITRLHDERAYEMIGGELRRNAREAAITADNTGRATALALWLRDEIGRGRLTLAPGLRIETIRTDFDNRLAGRRNGAEYTVVLPGLGISFAQTGTLTWLGGVHRGFSPASPGLSDPEPEEAINAEAGARWFSPLGRLEAIAFFSDYSNLTAQCTFSSGCDDAQIGEQSNAGRVEVAGLELSYSQEFVPHDSLLLPVSLGYTYTQGEFRERFDSANPQFGAVEPGFELPYVPEHRANLRLGLDAGRWQAALSLSHVSAMRDSAGNGPIPDGSGSDAYTVLDLAGHWRLRPELELLLRIDNLLDERYVVARRPFGARPGKPLTAQLGVDYHF